MDLDKKYRYTKMIISSSNLEHMYFCTHTEWPKYVEHLKQQNNI